MITHSPDKMAEQNQDCLLAVLPQCQTIRSTVHIRQRSQTLHN
jgi:hypothetical protein